jgi:predicted double-glycine peptidase
VDTWVDLLYGVRNPKKLSEIATLVPVPLVRQPNAYTCGVACVLSILGYYGQDLPYDWLTKELNANDKNGVDHRDIIKFFKSKDYDVALQKGMLVSDLMDLIDEKIPVIVCLQAWAKTTSTTDYGDVWDNGHYAVVVGYDPENLYFMDPSTLGNYASIPIDEFAMRWHDKDMDIFLRQSGIIVRGKKVFDIENIKRLL